MHNNHNIPQLLGLDSEKVIDSTDNNNFSQNEEFFADCEFPIEDNRQTNIANNNVQNNKKVRVYFTTVKCALFKYNCYL